jgi:acetate---CoA ligase (ADP-forming)
VRSSSPCRPHTPIASPFLGPNCLGFANLVDGILATAVAVIARNPQPGDVALVSQSGELAFGSMPYFRDRAGRPLHLGAAS